MNDNFPSAWGEEVDNLRRYSFINDYDDCSCFYCEVEIPGLKELSAPELCKKIDNFLTLVRDHLYIMYLVRIWGLEKVTIFPYFLVFNVVGMS